MAELRDILKTAVDSDASDVHLKLGQVPVYRIHGKLVDSEYETLDAATLEGMALTIMPSHAATAFEINHEADFSYHEKGVGRFRTNLFLAQGAPAVAMRYVKTGVPSFEELRLPVQLKDMARVERGIILVCGTTGSGKSTTLAAIIGEINRTQRRRIITIEDPIEYLFEDDRSVITQREVGIDTLSFQEAMIHLMRQDPDVVLIGEMRDQASIRTALLAAQTGHVVLSSMHATNSSIAIPRLLDMFPADEHDAMRMSLAETQHAVICQRMLTDVHGGFVPACEVMINTPTVHKLMERDRLDVLSAAIETGKEDGMQTFNQAIYQLIRDGLVSETEGMRYATNPEALKMNLKGIFLDEGSRILSDLL